MAVSFPAFPEERLHVPRETVFAPRDLQTALGAGP
jgi:hypothetical protein